MSYPPDPLRYTNTPTLQRSYLGVIRDFAVPELQRIIANTPLQDRQKIIAVFKTIDLEAPYSPASITPEDIQRVFERNRIRPHTMGARMDKNDDGAISSYETFLTLSEIIYKELQIQNARTREKPWKGVGGP